MAQNEMDDNRWVDERLDSLNPGEWRPDSSAAFARLRRRDGAVQPSRRGWWMWLTVSATAAVVVIAFLLLSAPPACANPLGCKQEPSNAAPAPAPAPAPPVVIEQAPAPAPPPAAAPAAAVAAAPVAKAQPHKRNYKESGARNAPITCELFTDFQCPHCALFYLETLPQLITNYVDTGKVKLIHRDFPLPMHPYARTAALYANAAGELGYYDVVSRQLFKTQGIWSGDGDVDLQVRPVLPADVMEKVRTLVKTDPAVAASISTDMDRVHELGINQTPTLVVTAKGDRQVLPGNSSFALLKSYLDDLLKK